MSVPPTARVRSVPSADDLLAQVEHIVQASDEQLQALRRDIHRHPELSWQEHRTTALIEEKLAGLGLRPERMDGTGVVADLGAPEPRLRVALRADLDALPVHEQSGVDFSSQNSGAAHACGHDVHTVALLGAAMALSQIEESLRELGLGVRLIFQPAEETMPGGALKVIEEGWLDGVDRLFGLHCDPTIDVGQVGLREGAITAASDSVRVSVHGRGGHTSRPHLTQDVTLALSKIVADTPSILARRTDPRAAMLLVWGSIRAGTAPNVIPSTGECMGTVRTLDEEAWASVGPLIEEIVYDVARPYGVTASVDHVQGVPPVVNEHSCVAALVSGADAVLGGGCVVSTPQSMGGEDMGWYLQKIPGAMARLGTRSPGGATYELHQGDLVVDEEAVVVGAKVLAAAVITSIDAGIPGIGGVG